ncbi:MAG: 16S rRNA (adenine(1518)-N(6)/adenine(1519)-N(6)) -dimethyltransferase RsmA [Candidatus Microsyncoccus archaeolyticus]|nr:MAG: 16S rRNA (adenine(1518)-N(6)/adenine(1519)-N(6)) -dimethyltransferase RsmA [Candidatus Parcubacteria bacterium]
MSSVFSTIKSQGITPKKSLGQNFLIDENIVRKIAKTANIKKTDVVVEIGPGTGVLTKELALYAKKVIAIEKDEKLAKSLDIKNVKVITGDALIKIRDIRGKYKVVANIPYYLTSFLIRTLLELENKPVDIVLLIQKEVAKRICSEENSLLSLSVKYYAKAEIIDYVSRNCFFPKPKVDSAIIKITLNKRKKNDSLFKLIKKGFSHPRKTLINNLKQEKIEEFLTNRELDLKIRPEKLDIKDWIDLHSFIQRK